MPETDEQKRVRQEKRLHERTLATFLLFTPWKSLRLPISIATREVDAYFTALDAELERQEIGEAVGEVGMHKALERCMDKLIRVACIHGFEAAGSITGEGVTRGMRERATYLAARRAGEVSRLMDATTGQWLEDDPTHSFALSTARAERAARFEAARSYYGGLQQALAGRELGKAWITTSPDPCEVCLDNEDAGVIDMEDVFPSGDDAPLAHLNCQCILHVTRL